MKPSPMRAQTCSSVILGHGEVEAGQRVLGKGGGNADGRARNWYAAFLLSQWMAASLPTSALASAHGSPTPSTDGWREILERQEVRPAAVSAEPCRDIEQPL